MAGYGQNPYGLTPYGDPAPAPAVVGGGYWAHLEQFDQQRPFSPLVVASFDQVLKIFLARHTQHEVELLPPEDMDCSTR